MPIFRCITAQERIKLFICIQCEFCIELTSLSQETVEKSLIFIDILNESIRNTFEKFARNRYQILLIPQIFGTLSTTVDLLSN